MSAVLIFKTQFGLVAILGAIALAGIIFEIFASFWVSASSPPLPRSSPPASLQAAPPNVSMLL
jgi:hypothetical protein